MKTTIKKSQPTPERPYYPCVKVNRNADKVGEYVVLFSTPNTGVVIASNAKICPVGLFTDGWIYANNESAWEPFVGTVTYGE